MRLIDADAFYEKFRAGGDLYSELLEAEDMRKILKDEQMTPTVDAKPAVHAHWERIGFDFKSMACPSEKIMCSMCGTIYKRSEVGTPRYCPNCGAKMDEK